MSDPNPPAFTFNPENPFTMPAASSSSTATPFTFLSASSSSAAATPFSFSSPSSPASDATATGLNSSFAAFSMGTPEKSAVGIDASASNPFTFQSPSSSASTATPFTFSSPTGANFTFSAPTTADVTSPTKANPTSSSAANNSSTAATTAPPTSAFSSANFQFAAPVLAAGTSASNPFIAPSSKDFEKPVTAAAFNKATASSATATTAAAAPKTTPTPMKSKYAVEAPPEPEPVDDSFPPVVPRMDLSRQYAVIFNPEQKILDAIAWACRDTFTNPSYDVILQRIKHFFFHRQFEKVFGDPKHLNVYVAQYLPMRVLCYYNLWSSHPLLGKLLEKDVTIYCIGAGPGSELMGISMSRENILRNKIKMGKLSLAQAIAPSVDGTLPTGVIPKFRIHTQDLFNWEPSLKEILQALITHAPLSYRSTNFTFSNANIMDPQLKTAQFKNSHVVTMMFVLNELFQENKAATMQFLDRLISAMRPGAFLIVADSAGDFSQLEIGAKAKPSEEEQQESGQENVEGDGSSADAGQGAEFEDDEGEESSEPKPQSTTASASSSSNAAPAKPRRRYWIYSLLDAIPALSIVHAEDSIWYRYPGKEKNLTYPLKFENMRYFLRIYQKKA